MGAGPDDDPFALLGALSLDIYTGRDLVLPGGGVLNMAWHWRRSGTPFHLLSRVGDDRPEVFGAFLARHGIPHSPELVTPGRSASIDIVIRPDLQPHMDHFLEGVWASFALTPTEERRLAEGRRLHLVLVEGAIRELARLADAGRLAGLEVSADFLGFRHYTLARLAETMRMVDVGFVGWPGAPDDQEVTGIRAIAHDLRRLIVVTFGSQGVWGFDGRDGGAGDAFVPVVPVPVTGTTVGCGDAFIAGFLAAWRRNDSVAGAIEAGKAAGAEATGWRRPLPEEAYGPEAAGALREADASAVRSAGGDPGPAHEDPHDDGLRIRAAAPGDAAVLASLGARTFRDTYRGRMPEAPLTAHITDTFTEARIESELRDPRNVHLLAIRGGTAIGYAKLREGPAHPSVAGPAPIELERIYVARAATGAGVGGRLLQAAVASGAARGAWTLWLGVWEENEQALRFYERMGFGPVGSQAFELGGIVQRDVVLALPIGDGPGARSGEPGPGQR